MTYAPPAYALSDAADLAREDVKRHNAARRAGLFRSPAEHDAYTQAYTDARLALGDRNLDGPAGRCMVNVHLDQPCSRAAWFKVRRYDGIEPRESDPWRLVCRQHSKRFVEVEAL